MADCQYLVFPDWLLKTNTQYLAVYFFSNPPIIVVTKKSNKNERKSRTDIQLIKKICIYLKKITVMQFLCNHKHKNVNVYVYFEKYVFPKKLEMLL